MEKKKKIEDPLKDAKKYLEKLNICGDFATLDTEDIDDILKAIEIQYLFNKGYELISIAMNDYTITYYFKVMERKGA